jgi:hypothetical protein
VHGNGGSVARDGEVCGSGDRDRGVPSGILPSAQRAGLIADGMIALQGQLITLLAAQNAALAARVAELRTQNAELEERAARLERLISRNSGNSSMPPSTDDLPGKKPPERRPRRGAGRRPGKQPGAPGAYLAWREHPDMTEDVFPAGRCECSRGLAGARDLGVAYSHQVTNLPEARAQTTQYDRHVLHQLCTAHILRDLQDAAQAYPDAIRPGQAADALRALIHAANTARGTGLATVPDSQTAGGLLLFRNAVRVGLSQVRRMPGANTKQPPGRLLLECLRDREADVLRFLADLRVPPTSNQAERDLRPAKTQQKISGRLRSETATRHRYAIRGYISTAAKHRTGIITAIRDALAGNPWMPPIPA